MLIGSLYVVARGERFFFFKLSIHGTPYNVFENRDDTNILQAYIIILSIFFFKTRFRVRLEMFMVCRLMFCTLDNDWYTG